MNRLILALFGVLIVVGGLIAEKNPGKDSSDKPKTGPVGLTPYSAELVKEILADVKAHGDARRGAAVFGSTTLACLSCHIVGGKGGTIGPDLTNIGRCLPPPEIVEAVVWPKRQVRPEYVAIAVTLTNGTSLQGYKEKETDDELLLREPGTKTIHRIAKRKIDERREIGSLMPD